MRNLKRALSLALASVMLLGMMVVGTSAASFPDVDDNDNTEAIEVLNAVGVMIGNNVGNFEPDKNVTRNEMAAVIARLLLGAEAETYIGAHPFSDVPSWAQKYVAACYDNGIVTGRSATIYDGNSTVTAQEAATMMLRVLGYEQITGTGADWAKPVVAKANQIRLFKGVTGSATAPMNRNDVAKLALNTLEADMVETTIDPYYNGVGVSYQVSYDLRKDLNNSNSSYNYTNDKDNTHQKEYLQLCEDLYDGKLTKRSVADDFGCPATKWSYKGKEINKFANEPTLTYLDAVKSSDIYKDLGLSEDMPKENVKFWIDGVDEDTNQGADTPYILSSDTSATVLNTVKITKNDNAFKDVKVGGKGAVTKVFYNSDATTDKITVVVTDYYLAKATDDYNTKNEEVKVTIYKATEVSDTLKGDDLPVAGVRKDDYLVVTIAGGAVKTVAPATVVENVVVTAARSKDYVTAGEKYAYSDISEGLAKAVGQSFMLDATSYDLNGEGYNLYLDPNGYVLGVEGYDGGVNMGNYLFVKEIGSGNFTTDAVAKALFSDGTTKTINVSKVDGDDADTGPTGNFRKSVDDKKFYKFTVSGNNYKLTLADRVTGIAQDKEEHASLDSKVFPITKANNDSVDKYANESTLFIAKDKVSTGVKNAPKVAASSGTPAVTNNVYYLYSDAADSKDRLLWVYTTNTGAVTASVEDLVYILDGTYQVEHDAQSKLFYTYKVWKNGTVESNFQANDEVGVGLYKVDTFTDGRADLATKRVASTAGEFIKVDNVGSAYSYDAPVLDVSGTKYALKSDVKVYAINEGKHTADTINPSSLKSAWNDGYKSIILVREKDDGKSDIAVIYVIK